MSNTNQKTSESNHRLLTLPRGKERRESHFHIVIETLRVLEPQYPTRDQFQRYAKIRRKRFIAVLKYLVDTGAIIKFGLGSTQSPFRYRLAE